MILLKKIISKLEAKVLLAALFLLSILFIPIQYRFYKIFRPLSHYLLSLQGEVPAYFEKNIGFYTTDLFMIGASLFFVFSSKVGWKTFFFSKSTKYLTMLFLFGVVTLLCSSSAGYPLQYFRLLQFLIVLVFFCALYHYFRNEETKDFMQKIFLAILAVALFECFVGITQYFLQNRVGLKFFGEVNIGSPNAVHSVFTVPDGTLWSIDRLLGITREKTSIVRSYGTMQHPNIFGGFLFFSVMITYYLHYLASSWKKTLLSLAIFLQIFTLCLTFSRSAMIATFLSTLFWVAALFFYKRDERKKAYSLLLLVIASASLCILLLYPQFLERGGVLNYNKLVQGADAERIVYQKISYEMIKENPWFGVGFNNFLLKMKNFATDGTTPIWFQSVHNIYLLIAAEQGIIGLILFLFFIGSLLWHSFKKKLDPVSITLISAFLGFLFIGICDCYPLTSQAGKVMFFVTAALLLAVSYHRSLESGSERSNSCF